MLKNLIIPFICLFIIGCDRDYHNNLLENLLGINNVSYKIICSHEEFSYGGEGFYYCVYQLEEVDINRILDNKLPSTPQYRKDWSVIKWKKTPIDSSDIELFNHCVKFNIEKNFKDCFLRKLQNENLMNNDKYYSAFYYDNKQEPYYVDFIILIPKEKKLYFVSQKI